LGWIVSFELENEGQPSLNPFNWVDVENDLGEEDPEALSQLLLLDVYVDIEEREGLV